MRVLQICYKMPYPIRDGGEYSIYHSGLSLLKKEEISLKVIAINTPKFWVDVDQMPKAYKDETDFEAVRVDTRVKLPSLAWNLFTRQSYFVSRFYSSDFEQRLVAILAAESYDIILVEHVYLCCYLTALKAHSKAKVVLRAQNIEYQLWESYTQHHRNFFARLYLNLTTKRLERFEKSMFQQVDGIIALTEIERQTITNIAPKTPITAIPIGFDFSKIASSPPPTEIQDPPIIYHLGSMDWRPNIQGIEWFIQEVLPLLIQQAPDIRIHLAGKKMPDSIYEFACPQLIIDGEVEDAMVYQHDKAILMVPLLSGGGIRVKIIEGLALGKTIISTSKGAEGIPYVDGKHLLIADTAAEFAEQLLRCYRDVALCKSISAEASGLAREAFELGSIGDKKMSFFKKLD